MGKLTISMAIFNSYVSLPEGNGMLMGFSSSMIYIIDTLNYEQGPLGGTIEPPQGFYNLFPRGGPGDQLDDVRTLEVCFEGVLESYHGESGK